MNPLEFVLAIVFLVLAYKVVSIVLHNRASRPVQDAPERNADVARQLADLEERVRVLERIVTDDRSELKRQFRELNG
jgi:membrane protein implicated in regulation of membrane protease activity